MNWLESKEIAVFELAQHGYLNSYSGVWKGIDIIDVCVMFYIYM